MRRLWPNCLQFQPGAKSHPNGFKGFHFQENSALVPSFLCILRRSAGTRRGQQREERLAEEPPATSDRAGHGPRRHIQGSSFACGAEGDRSLEALLVSFSGVVHLIRFSPHMINTLLAELCPARPSLWRCQCTAMAARGRSRSRSPRCKVGDDEHGHAWHQLIFVPCTTPIWLHASNISELALLRRSCVVQSGAGEQDGDRRRKR